MRPKFSVATIVAKTITRTIARAWHDARGATAMEYGLIIALVVLALIAGLTGLANATAGMWGNVNDKVATAR